MIKDIERNNENISINDKSISILKEHFSSCFKKDGSFDIERFKEELKDKVDVVHEGYELKFLGKSYAKLLASLDTTTVITPNPEHNNLPENKNSENIYISGDNLDGLKHLLKSYSKSVKCIYIDPPYNTGSDGFVYKDNFNFSVDELQDKLSVDETQAKRILDLTKRNSASHSAWLMFMYARLQLAKDLLKDDGVIFISIDDNEQANLKLLCDDIFGEENYIAQFSWQKKTGASDAVGIATITESILTYVRKKADVNSSFTKNKDLFDENRYDSKDEYEEERGKYYPDNLDRGGLNYSDSMNFGIKCPDGTMAFPNGRTEYFNDGWIWKWSVKKVQWGVENGFIEFRRSKNKANGWAVCYKNYMLVDNENNEMIRSAAHKNLLLNLLNTKGTSDLKELFGQDIFKNSKPVDLIYELISYINFSKNDIFLDFFSGSSTSAQSIFKLNSNENDLNIKFINIQLQEECKLNSKAYLAGYKTIDEIGIERIIRASKKIKSEPKADIDFGFKHFILNEPNQNTLDKCETFDAAGLLGDATILDDFGTETVLTTWLNNDGYGLNAKVETIDLDGYISYYCKKHLYLINPDFTQEAMVALFEKYDTIAGFNPENIVLFGYSFIEWSVTEMLEKNLKILNDSEKNLKINIDVRY
ncbi:site-specific DNA-methyltransferase [Flavobacterium sp. 83]|uniref:site-specific DNA-methyltransferase n=1 Tax=Flavobacterium sp. 83 TaxID=1131812 RepID=UPI00054F06E0|nr:site-specific DNA-methyltransferase [Flavobacterium sp. 83]